MEPIFEHCEFGNWYPKFKELTTKTRILEAPEAFREYLLSDGIVLHEDGDESSSEWECDVPNVDANDSDSVEKHKPPYEFHQKIEKVISELNGEVTPKLNWSAPVDAKWILPSNTMRCTTANDIYMLLKSSDYINHDLLLKPSKLTLVLREWYDIHPSNEFRCFVHEKQLVGVCQRDINYYDFLNDARQSIELLCTDMAAKISDKFADNSFVFDIYIPRKFTRAWLVDINPWHSKTDSILFDWEELKSLKYFTLRLIEREDRSRAFSSKPHSSSQVPYEFVDMQQETLQEMLKQMKLQQKAEAQENEE